MTTKTKQATKPLTLADRLMLLEQFTSEQVNLFNSAPKLLEACKLWLEALPELKINSAYSQIFSEIRNKTEQAIAKAEGQG